MDIKFNIYHEDGYSEKVAVVPKDHVKEMISSWKGSVVDGCRNGVAHWFKKDTGELHFSIRHHISSPYDCTGQTYCSKLIIKRVFTNFYAVNIVSMYDV